jgi:hypothetical protein
MADKGDRKQIGLSVTSTAEKSKESRTYFEITPQSQSTNDVPIDFIFGDTTQYIDLKHTKSCLKILKV